MTEEKRILEEIEGLRRQVENNAKEVNEIKLALFGRPESGIIGWIEQQARTNRRLDEISGKMDTLLEERQVIVSQIRGAVVAIAVLIIVGLILAGNWEWVWRLVSAGL